MNTQSTRRFVSALLLFAMVFGMFGFFVPPAAACQPNKPCADAPGQVKQDAPVVVTVDAKDVNVVPGTLTNNGGNTVNGNGNGVVNQALQGTNNATVTIQVTSLEEAPQLPANTNATIIVVAEEADADASAAGTTQVGTTTVSTTQVGTTNTTSNGGGSINHTMEELLAFESTLTFTCGAGASHSSVACWNHFPISNLYRANGKPYCGDTSNANNELTRTNGGWLVKLDQLLTKVEEDKLNYGPVHTCP